MTLKNPVLALAFALMLVLGAVAGIATAASGTTASPAIVAATDGGDSGGDEAPGVDVDVDPDGGTGIDPVWLIVIVAIIALVIFAVVAANGRRGDTTIIRDDRPR